jgi:iron(III) transport system ATP-binding protein
LEIVMSVIQLKNVSKGYAGCEAVRNVSLTIEQGDLLVLLGHSGCGKTTTLRLLAGLETPDTGEIWLNGKRVAGVGAWMPPEARGVGMVFQDYALFPHLTIAANVAFPLNKWNAGARKARVEEMLDLVGLRGLGDRYPHQLSGGQQQRVALARALAAQPSVVLLDEPFSNLDAALRQEMREEVRRILKFSETTAVFVTHDQEEALSLADQVAVMSGGRLLQVGTPQEVYLSPASRAVAEFLGDVNFVPGVANGDGVDCPLGTLTLTAPVHGSVDVMVRPETIALRSDPMGSAYVTDVRFFGHDQLVSVCLEGQHELRVRTWPRPELRPGARVSVAINSPVLAYSR